MILELLIYSVLCVLRFVCEGAGGWYRVVRLDFEVEIVDLTGW